MLRKKTAVTEILKKKKIGKREKKGKKEEEVGGRERGRFFEKKRGIKMHTVCPLHDTIRKRYN